MHNHLHGRRRITSRVELFQPTACLNSLNHTGQYVEETVYLNIE